MTPNDRTSLAQGSRACVARQWRQLHGRMTMQQCGIAIPQIFHKEAPGILPKRGAPVLHNEQWVEI